MLKDGKTTDKQEMALLKDEKRKWRAALLHLIAIVQSWSEYRTRSWHKKAVLSLKFKLSETVRAFSTVCKALSIHRIQSESSRLSYLDRHVLAKQANAQIDHCFLFCFVFKVP